MKDCIYTRVASAVRNLESLTDCYRNVKLELEKNTVVGLTVTYYGSKVFSCKIDKDGKHTNQTFNYCGYEGSPRTTKTINACLEGSNAVYRVKTHKGKGTIFAVRKENSRHYLV